MLLSFIRMFIGSVMSADPASKWERKALDTALPDIWITLFSAKTSEKSYSIPDPFIKFPRLPRKLIIGWKPPNLHTIFKFTSWMIPVAASHKGWSNVIHGTTTLSALACWMMKRRVENMQFSSDGFISIIGRNEIDAFSLELTLLVTYCIKPFQFGRCFSAELKNQTVCHKRS